MLPRVPLSVLGWGWGQVGGGGHPGGRPRAQSGGRGCFLRTGRGWQQVLEKPRGPQAWRLGLGVGATLTQWGGWGHGGGLAGSHTSAPRVPRGETGAPASPCLGQSPGTCPGAPPHPTLASQPPWGCNTHQPESPKAQTLPTGPDPAHRAPREPSARDAQSDHQGNPDCGRSTSRGGETQREGRPPAPSSGVPRAEEPRQRQSSSPGAAAGKRRPGALSEQAGHPGPRPDGQAEAGGSARPLRTQADQRKESGHLLTRDGGSKSGHFHIGAAREHKLLLQVRVGAAGSEGTPRGCGTSQPGARAPGW